jgi:hypothetical protein
MICIHEFYLFIKKYYTDKLLNYCLTIDKTDFDIIEARLLYL